MATTATNIPTTTNARTTVTTKPKFSACNSQIYTTSSSTSPQLTDHDYQTHHTLASKDHSSPKIFEQNCTVHNLGSASASLSASLSGYKYLDDYEYYREERMKHNAMRNFGLILQSIKTKYKDCSQQSAFDDDNSDSDIISGATPEFFDFNRILKRHKKRFRQRPANHHHRR